LEELGDDRVDVVRWHEEGVRHVSAQGGSKVRDGGDARVGEQGVRDVERDGAPVGLATVEGDALQALGERPGHGGGGGLGLEEAHEGGAAIVGVGALEGPNDFGGGREAGLEIVEVEGPAIGEEDDGEGREGGELTRLIE
jgi:hypothetical protein